MQKVLDRAAVLDRDEFCFRLRRDDDKQLCTVYNDGSHYIAVPYKVKVGGKKQCRTDLSCFDFTFKDLWLKAMNEGISYRETAEYIRDKLVDVYPDVDFDWDTYVGKMLRRERNNLRHRVKLFRRKVYLNKWNYWVTITYDDNKFPEGEDQFKKALRKCLANLHTRRGWRYAGVPEHAPGTGRLHYHLLMYIPLGELIGKIEEKESYSTSEGRIKKRMENSFFAGRFGVNDFQELNQGMLHRGSSVNYLLKYIAKSGVRLIYSRGVRSSIVKRISPCDFAARLFDFAEKYVLYDDVISYEYDVLRPKFEQVKAALNYVKSRKPLQIA